jgi:hypothetical protein
MADHDRQTQAFGEQDRHTHVFGEQGEPCQGCGSPLAADQRYCLNCGHRRGGPRVDYAKVMGDANGDSDGTGRQEPEPTPAPTAAGERPERDYAPLAAVGGIAVLGLMLLVGVLIGKGNTSTSSAPAPIVKVGATEGGAGEGAAADKSETTAAKPKKAGGSKKVDTGAKTVGGGLTGSAARNSNATVQATTNDLEALEGKSGESYEESVKKLPDKIATPGAPPPIDKTKAAGGGGSAETIE